MIVSLIVAIAIVLLTVAVVTAKLGPGEAGRESERGGESGGGDDDNSGHGSLLERRLPEGFYLA